MSREAAATVAGGAPDAALIDLLIQLRPTRSEPRGIAVLDGKVGVLMSPKAAEVYGRVMARLQAIYEQHGEEFAIATFDASVAASHLKSGGVH